MLAEWSEVLCYYFLSLFCFCSRNVAIFGCDSVSADRGLNDEPAAAQKGGGGGGGGAGGGGGGGGYYSGGGGGGSGCK